MNLPSLWTFLVSNNLIMASSLAEHLAAAVKNLFIVGFSLGTVLTLEAVCQLYRRSMESDKPAEVALKSLAGIILIAPPLQGSFLAAMANSDPGPNRVLEALALRSPTLKVCSTP